MQLIAPNPVVDEETREEEVHHGDIRVSMQANRGILSSMFRIAMKLSVKMEDFHVSIDMHHKCVKRTEDLIVMMSRYWKKRCGKLTMAIENVNTIVEEEFLVSEIDRLGGELGEIDKNVLKAERNVGRIKNRIRVLNVISHEKERKMSLLDESLENATSSSPLSDASTQKYDHDTSEKLEEASAPTRELLDKGFDSRKTDVQMGQHDDGMLAVQTVGLDLGGGCIANVLLSHSLCDIGRL